MKIYHAKTKLNFDGHRCMVIIDYVPNWFERFFYRWKDMRIRYVGSGVKWMILNHKRIAVPIPASHQKFILPVLQQVQSRVAFTQRYLLRKGITLKRF
jgi:hypothetical protein